MNAPRPTKWWHCTWVFVLGASILLPLFAAIEIDLIRTMVTEDRPDLLGGVIGLGVFGAMGLVAVWALDVQYRARNNRGAK